MFFGDQATSKVTYGKKLHIILYNMEKYIIPDF